MGQEAAINTGSDAPELWPDALPLFPLRGVLLLPRGNLPLNVYEPRYKAMVEDALTSHNLIGIIQPREAHGDDPALFTTGCVGRITAHEKTDDGRYLINLTGLSRFNVIDEFPLHRGYRRARADFAPYEPDLTPVGSLDLDRVALKSLLRPYFQAQGLSCEWSAIDGAPDEKLITCLSMICPFDAGEKQALLESACCRDRADKFMTMLKMALHEKDNCCGGCH